MLKYAQETTDTLTAKSLLELACEEYRARAMPTEKDALRVLFEAFQRLKDLGWKEAIYCPKDGRHIMLVTVGSTGIHEGNCLKGSDGHSHFWAYSGNDIWPINPILFKALSEFPE